MVCLGTHFLKRGVSKRRKGWTFLSPEQFTDRAEALVLENIGIVNIAWDGTFNEETLDFGFHSKKHWIKACKLLQHRVELLVLRRASREADRTPPDLNELGLGGVWKIKCYWFRVHSAHFKSMRKQNGMNAMQSVSVKAATQRGHKSRTTCSSKHTSVIFYSSSPLFNNPTSPCAQKYNLKIHHSSHIRGFT